MSEKLTLDSKKTGADRSVIQFRGPVSTDGSRVWGLVRECRPLDINSMYCNLLQCSHFSSTSILAESGYALCGFISGYRLPEQPDVLFVWQVAVAPEYRGQGLAMRMLRALTERVGNEVHFVHTSITDTNQASWSTFRRLARELEAPLSTRVMFARDTHFEGEHDTETLVCIGPFNLTDTADGIAQNTLTES